MGSNLEGSSYAGDQGSAGGRRPRTSRGRHMPCDLLVGRQQWCKGHSAQVPVDALASAHPLPSRASRPPASGRPSSQAGTWGNNSTDVTGSIAERDWSWSLVRQVFCLYDGCLTTGGRVQLSSARQVIRRLPGLFMSSAAGWSSTCGSSRLPTYPTLPRYADARWL